jgi:flagellar hook-length control protein FliK
VQPFTFDINTLSPAAGMAHGTFASPRPRARFEEHLGQATHTPRESSLERKPDAPEFEPAATETSDTAETHARERDDAGDDDRSPSSDQQSDNDNGGDLSGQGASAAAVADGKPATTKDKPADGNADSPTEATANRSGGKPGKFKGKPAHGHSQGEGAAAAAAQTTAGNAEHDASEQATDAAPGNGHSEPGGKDGSNPTRNGLPVELAAESASNGDPSAIAAAGAVAATGESQTIASKDGVASDELGAVEAIGDEHVKDSGKAEPPNAGKRGRSAKSAAVGDTIGPTAEPVVGSSEPAALAATAIESPAPTELSATADAAANKEPVTADARFNENHDGSEPRAGSAASVLAARNERFSGSAERGDGLTEAERVRFVQRVARAFHSMGDEGGEVRLRLSPPELGSLRLEVSVRDGVMSARLEAETASARNVLLENLPALRERLAEQNIKVERFDVDVRDEQRQPSHEQFTGQPDVPRQGQRERARGHEVKRPTAIAPAAPRAAMSSDNTGALNIVI